MATRISIHVNNYFYYKILDIALDFFQTFMTMLIIMECIQYLGIVSNYLWIYILICLKPWRTILTLLKYIIITHRIYFNFIKQCTIIYRVIYLTTTNNEL